MKQIITQIQNWITLHLQHSKFERMKKKIEELKKDIERTECDIKCISIHKDYLIGRCMRLEGLITKQGYLTLELVERKINGRLTR